MPPIRAASDRLRPSATAAKANRRAHCLASRHWRAKARRSAAPKSSRRGIAAVIGLDSRVAESTITGNHTLAEFGNPLIRVNFNDLWYYSFRSQLNQSKEHEAASFGLIASGGTADKIGGKADIEFEG